MADISDVTEALRRAIGQVLYPQGVAPGTAPPSPVAGAPVRVLVGWPDASLDADLAARPPIQRVTVWTRPVGTRLPPYLQGWETLPAAVPSLLATVEPESVLFSGNAGVPGMLAAVILGSEVGYSVAVGPGQTPAEVAQALAALAAAGAEGVPPREAWAEGARLMLPGAPPIQVRIAAPRRERKEVERFRQGIQVTAWCSSRAMADTLIKAVDEMRRRARSLLLPDGTLATLTYTGTAYDEAQRQQPLYRRDLLIDAEYPAVVERVSPPVLVPAAGVTLLRGEGFVRRVVIV